MDERLRKLEREAALGGLDAQAKLILQRLRAGELTEKRIRLAAYLGDGAARLALGKEPVRTELNLVALVAGLDRWNKMASVRTIIAGSRLVLPVWEAYHPENRAPRVAIEAAEAWALKPSEENRKAAADAMRRVQWGYDEPRDEADVSARAVAKAAWHAARAASGQAREWTMVNPRMRGEDPRRILSAQAAEIAWQGISICLGPAAYAEHNHGMSRFSATLGMESLRGAIQTEVVPWALERDDPLLRR